MAGDGSGGDSPASAAESLAWSCIDDAPNRFRVHTRAYTDPGVLELEQQRIFMTSWIFVGHDSELPKPGDFKTAHVGSQPILLTRDQDGRLNALLNRCVHRGSVLCREPRGNASSFTCPYHAWSYANDGTLTAITDRAGYPDAFEAPAGLHRVPHVDSYRGFIFVCFDSGAPPLLEFLGRTKLLIDRKLNQAPAGTITVHPRPYVGRYDGNWKFHAENIIDGYHFMYTHQAFVKLQAKYGDLTGDFGVHKGGSPSEMKKIRTRGLVWGCAQGHVVNQKPSLDVPALLSGEFAPYFQSLLDRYGEEELAWVLGSNSAVVFPNLGMIHNQIRTWRPLAPNLTEVRIFFYDLDGAPAAFNEGMMRSQERFYGPAGHGMPDDLEIFAVNQQGLEASALEWLILERGLDRETELSRGDIEGMPSSESGHRAFWRRWRQLLGAKG